MVTRKGLPIVLFAFCLTAAVFAVMPVSSVGTYDPWLDYNDDGKIDLKDVYTMHQAYGAAGTPINKTQMLLDLQNRVTALEKRQNYVKTIRLYNSSETMHNGEDYKNASVFQWIPLNATNNAVLAVHCYFKYRSSQTSEDMAWWLKVNGNYAFSGIGFTGNTEYQQTVIYTSNPPSLTLMPNQNVYTIEFAFATLHATSGEIYVKEINVLLEVMDGLPPS